MPIPEQTPRNQNQKRAQRDLFVHSYDQLQSLDGNLVEVTPQSMLAAKKKANLNIAALQSLEDEDDSRKIKELGGQIDKLGEEMEYERAVSSKVADDKDGIVLALRRRIAALEDTIVRESTSTYSSQVNSIRQQPYYTNMRSGRTNGSTASGWLRKYGSKGSNPYVTPKPAQSSNDIYERKRIFEERLNLDDDFRGGQSIANTSYRICITIPRTSAEGPRLTSIPNGHLNPSTWLTARRMLYPSTPLGQGRTLPFIRQKSMT